MDAPPKLMKDETTSGQGGCQETDSNRNFWQIMAV